MPLPDGASPAVPRRRARGLGLPFLAIVGLALLVLPRIVVHDLGLLPPASPLYILLNVLPFVAWVLVAVGWSRRPWVSLVVAGGLYGVALAVVHNLAWNSVFGVQPQLGGSLGDSLSPSTQELLMRGATVLSSMGTGLVVGLVLGLIALGLQIVLRRSGRPLPRGRR